MRLVWRIGLEGVQKKGTLIPGDLMRIGNKEGQRG
jgi:hypothetical protein